MAGAWITCSFARLPGESDHQITRLTSELAGDLRIVAMVQHVPAASTGVLNVLTKPGPNSVHLLVYTVLAFLRRHENRRATLVIDNLEFALDHASPVEAATLVTALHQQATSQL